ncbi:MAG: HAD family hydrolase [Lachnospiraceae bacterium]
MPDMQVGVWNENSIEVIDCDGNRNKYDVIFDMDGVIFDSERAVYEGWLELSHKYGFQNLDIPYMKCIGVNAEASRQIFLDYYGEDFPYDAYRKEQSENYHAKYDNGRLPLKPGVRELLTALKSKGYRIAIASSTRTILVKKQIEDAGLLPFFDVIIGGDMVQRSKPNPDIFLKAARELKCSPEATYVIEDSYNGIRAAHTAGMIPIMVPDMLEPDDEMKQIAKYIMNDLTEVKSLLV